MYRKITFLCFFVFSLIFTVEGQISNVYIGNHPNLSTDVFNTAFTLFDKKILFTEPFELDLMNITEIDNAIHGKMDILFLCEGDYGISINSEMSNLMNEFVSQGGIIMYTSSFTEARSTEVSIWLNNPVINVSSTETSQNINQFYYVIEAEREYFQPDGTFRAQATDESLNTSFARIDFSGMYTWLESGGMYNVYNTWGLPFKRIPPDMYWIESYQRQMNITSENEQYCMFKRKAFSSGTIDIDEACWLFNFPHNSGYVIEIGTRFHNSLVFEQSFIDRTINSIGAAVGLHESQNTFEEHDTKIILLSPQDLLAVSEYQFYQNFANILYDMSLYFDVYFASHFDELSRLLEITDAVSVVINKLSYQYTDDFAGLVFTEDVSLVSK